MSDKMNWRDVLGFTESPPGCMADIALAYREAMHADPQLHPAEVLMEALEDARKLYGYANYAYEKRDEWHLALYTGRGDRQFHGFEIVAVCRDEGAAKAIVQLMNYATTQPLLIEELTLADLPNSPIHLAPTMGTGAAKVPVPQYVTIPPRTEELKPVPFNPTPVFGGLQAAMAAIKLSEGSEG